MDVEIQRELISDEFDLDVKEFLRKVLLKDFSQRLSAEEALDLGLFN